MEVEDEADDEAVVGLVMKVEDEVEDEADDEAVVGLVMKVEDEVSFCSKFTHRVSNVS